MTAAGVVARSWWLRAIVAGMADDRHAEAARDARRVARAQAGDASAFDQLVVDYAPRVLAVARRLGLPEHEAQEVTQETFLRAWRGLPSFGGRSSFATWIYRIVVNETNRRLARQPAASPQSLDALERDLVDPAPGPAGAAEQAELSAILEQAIAILPAEQRSVLVLRDIEGLSTREAAAVLGLREGAFKSRLHRARMAVREQLEAGT